MARVTVYIYLLTGVLTAVAGMVAAARTNGVPPGPAGAPPLRSVADDADRRHGVVVDRRLDLFDHRLSGVLINGGALHYEELRAFSRREGLSTWNKLVEWFDQAIGERGHLAKLGEEADTLSAFIAERGLEQIGAGRLDHSGILEART